MDYVVLSMDIPFQTVYDTNKVNSTTSALFYGLKDDTGPNWRDVTNSYAASEQIFRQANPASAPGYSFLTTMLTAGSLAQAKLLVDQGVASDATFPTQPVILAKTSDPLRNIRYREFDNAIFNTRLRGNCLLLRTNADSPWGQTNLLGYQTGLASFSVSPNTFVPGAMADSLTSYGGIIFGPNGQTTLLAFINAGAAGSYGTVTEPTASTQKFPDPQDYFYQSRGFSLAECYYQSLYAPYEGLIVGEPLAAPFAQAGSGGWTGVATNAVLSGTAQLGVAFSAADANHPLQQIDLFVDGTVLPNLDQLRAPSGQPADRGPQRLSAHLHRPHQCHPRHGGQRSGGPAERAGHHESHPGRRFRAWRPRRVALAGHQRPGHPVLFHGRRRRPTQRAGITAPSICPAPPPQLTSTGRTSDGAFRLHVETPAGVAVAFRPPPIWLPGSPSSPMGRPVISWMRLGLCPPVLSDRGNGAGPAPALTSLGFATARISVCACQPRAPCPILSRASTNLAQLEPHLHQLVRRDGGCHRPAGHKPRAAVYRTLILRRTCSVLSVENSTNAGGLLVQVKGAAQPCVILESTNQVQWTPVFTNLAVGQIQTAVGSSTGSANALTTFLTASRSTFLEFNRQRAARLQPHRDHRAGRLAPGQRDQNQRRGRQPQRHQSIRHRGAVRPGPTIDGRH